MYVKWAMLEFLRISCMESYNLGQGLLANLSYALGMFERETCWRNERSHAVKNSKQER